MNWWLVDFNDKKKINEWFIIKNDYCFNKKRTILL